MRVKYCNNCQAWQESWAEHLKDSKYSDDRCWKCDKYELTSKVIVLPQTTFIEEETILKGGEVKVIGCGPTKTIVETVEFNKDDGSYSYNKTVSKGTLGRIEIIEVPPKRPPSPKCRIS